MRTPPAKFLTDMESGKSLFYLLKVTSDTTTYYWVTTPETFDLWPNMASDHGGAALTKDATRIAAVVDGEANYGIGSVETGLDIEVRGAGGGEIGDFTFTILNQDEYSDTINSQNFLNRAVELRMGFVDKVNGTGVNDCQLIASYTTDSVESFEWGRLVFHCVDGEFLRDKLLPNVVVTKQSHPRAPESSYGLVLPYLYGDFYTFNNTEVGSGTGLYQRHFEQFDVVPTIATSYSKSTISGTPDHTIASHECHTIDTLKYYNSQEAVGSIAASETTNVNNSTVAGFDIFATFDVTWYLIPTTETDTLPAGATAAVESGANPFDSAVDKDGQTRYTLYGQATYPSNPVYLGYRINKQGEGLPIGMAYVGNDVSLRDVQMKVWWNAIGPLYGAQQTGIRSDTSLGLSGYILVTSVNANSVVTASLYNYFNENGAADFDWDTITNIYEYAFYAYGVGVGGEIAHIVVLVKSRVNRKFGSATMGRSGRTPGRGG